jgi:hypothetical protein
MADYDEQIRNMIQGHSEADRAEEVAAREEWFAAQQREAQLIRDARQRGTAVIELCERFVDWANTNNVPSSAPSQIRFFGAGWLLGLREIDLDGNGGEVTHPRQPVRYSILARPSGKLQEITVSTISIRRPRHFASSLDRPERYRVESIAESIASIAHANKKKW